MNLIDGKKTSILIKEEIKKEVERLKLEYQAVPGLAVIIVGDDPASKVYVNSKVKTCEQLGIYSEKYIFSSDISQESLLELINKLNIDKNINGILVQLPLPKHIDAKKVIGLISPHKDVDGFNAENIGKVLIGDKDTFNSCTPYGVIELLKRYDLAIAGQDVVIVGRSNIVGKPLAAMLINESATVTVCHSKTKNLREKIRNADIVIAALGIPKFITKDMVKEDAIVIDVGINRLENGKLCGDVDFEEVSKIASYISPVPGGVGPMTIAMLMKNTLNSFKKTL